MWRRESARRIVGPHKGSRGESRLRFDCLKPSGIARSSLVGRRKFATVDATSRAREIADALVAGKRGALARAITLAESTRPDHRRMALAIQERLIERSHSSSESAGVGMVSGRSRRIGISGPPGVGKSTFVEALGKLLIDEGHRVGVFAVDPSSKLSGGSILGDKTRMESLANDDRAFVRPAPSSGELGGVTRTTSDVLLLFEAAGYDYVLVETVGVGQSETTVDEMVDLFLLLVSPGGGDDLQGIKRGIVELADVLIVNKSDGALETTARRTAADYSSALRIMRSRDRVWKPKVMRCSAFTGTGLDKVFSTIEGYFKVMSESGQLDKRRGQQAERAMWRTLHELIEERIAANAQLHELSNTLTERVRNDELTSRLAAESLLSSLGLQSPKTP